MMDPMEQEDSVRSHVNRWQMVLMNIRANVNFVEKNLEDEANHRICD